MTTLIVCITAGFILLFLIIFLIAFFIKFRSDRLLKSITSFNLYVTVLEYYMEKAYTIVYKDKLLVYSTEGMKVNDIEFASIAKGYTSLVLKMMGPVLKEEFLTLYGNEETFLFNIVEYFHSRYESDEIQKSVTDKMMNGDDTSMDKIFS